MIEKLIGYKIHLFHTHFSCNAPTGTVFKNYLRRYIFRVKYFGSSSITAQSGVKEIGCPAQRDQQQNHDSDSEWDSRCHVDRTTWESAKPFSEVPGLRKKFPFIENTLKFMPGGKYHKLPIMVLMKRLHDEFGLIVRVEGVLGLDDSIFLSSPEDVEKVYKQEALLPERDIVGSMTYFRKHFRQDIFKDARGLATSNKVNGIMMQPKVIKQYLKPVDTVAKDFVDKIKRFRNPDGTMGGIITKITNEWAVETIGFISLDQRLGALEDNPPHDSPSQRLIHNAAEGFKLAEKLDFQPSLWRYVWTPTYGKAMKLYDAQISLAQDHAKNAIKIIKEKRRSGEKDGEDDKEKSVLEKLWDVDPKVAVVMVTDTLFAGIETTSCSLVNILYHLSTNPDKQDVLRKEILSLLPDKNSEIKAEHLSEMPYLKACIKEAARIYPATVGTLRNLTKDTVLSGYQIPKGTKILLTHMYMSRMESQFPRPLEYIPERWLRDNDTELSYKNAHPFSSMQFGFGSRSCIGRRFADLELEIAVANFVRSFNMSWKGDPPTEVSISINYLKPPFGFIFKDFW